MKPRVLSTNTLFAPLVALARGLIRRVRVEGVFGSRQELASLPDAMAATSAGLCAGEGSAFPARMVLSRCAVRCGALNRPPPVDLPAAPP